MKFFILIFWVSFLLNSYIVNSQVKDIDGNSYDVFKINNKLWFTENLRTSKFNNGEKIYEAKSPEDWIKINKQKKPAFYKLDNEYLYNWYAVNDKRGLAPKGCYIAKYNDFYNLVDLPKSFDYMNKNDLINDFFKKGYFNALSNPYVGIDGNRYGFLNGYSSWWTSSKAYKFRDNEMNSNFLGCRDCSSGNIDIIGDANSLLEDTISSSIFFILNYRPLLTAYSFNIDTQNNGHAVRCIKYPSKEEEIINKIQFTGIYSNTDYNECFNEVAFNVYNGSKARIKEITFFLEITENNEILYKSRIVLKVNINKFETVTTNYYNLKTRICYQSSSDDDNSSYNFYIIGIKAE
jgi:uncharacterized protein (TIGR02145 family)